MENDKKFTREMFGYDKKEVQEYIKALKAEYESRIQAERSDANRISNELTIVKKKLERYEIDLYSDCEHSMTEWTQVSRKNYLKICKQGFNFFN